MPSSKPEQGAYAEINKKWLATCRIVFGEELGELDSCLPWMSERYSPRLERKSAIDGRSVLFADIAYPEDASCVAFEQVDFFKKYLPLPANSAASTSSILAAISDRISYTGNVVLGQSSHVEHSTNISDCHFAYHTERCKGCKYVAHSTQIVDSECIFGSSGTGASSFCVRPSSCMYCSRSFEISKCDHCSSCYYSHGLSGCSDCMFCFGLRSKRHCIGNVQLSPEKYSQIKEKLLSEMRETLRSKKRLPALYALFSGEPDVKSARELVSKMPHSNAASTARPAFIDKAWSETTNIVFGKPLGNIDLYSTWLLRNTRKPQTCKSCLSGKEIVLSEHADFFLMPKNRLIGIAEEQWLGERNKAPDSAIASLSMSNAAQVLSGVALFCPEWEMGISKGNVGCPVTVDSCECYKSILNINSKLCAFNYWARDSDHLFGNNNNILSSFCTNCFHSMKLSRCFEVDASRDCTGCYFCHNCENVHDSMFCFNAKNLKYAIGNAEVGREKFAEAKKMLLEGLNRELAEKHGVERSIFNLSGTGSKG